MTMFHDPERDASRYLAGAMTPDRRAAFAGHLLSCQTCWGEVQRARAGRAAMEAAREVAPADLLDRVRALVDMEARTGTPARRRTTTRRLRGPVFAGAASACLAVVLILGRSGGEVPAEPSGSSSLQQAVADYTDRVLPGTHMAASSAPDLSGLHLEAVGAGSGSFGELKVDGYSYSDPAGRRLVLYLSQEPFPEPAGAERLTAPRGPWMVHRGDVAVLCGLLAAPSSRAVLVVGQDDQLVTAVARTLGAL